MEMRCKTSPNTDIGIQQADDPYGELDRVAHRDGAECEMINLSPFWDTHFNANLLLGIQNAYSTASQPMSKVKPAERHG